VNSTDTTYPAATLLQTYTPKPTITTLPSSTPFLTDTPTQTPPPTNTSTPITPTRTRTPIKPRTPTPINTDIPATHAPRATNTPVPPSPTIPPPTHTQPPPALLSCSIDPSSVPAGINTQLTFRAQFSAPGYDFRVTFRSTFPGQTDCSGSAECTGMSGLLPSSTKVDVTFSSSVGDCTASYSSP
jgi:hypothetical protein